MNFLERVRLRKTFSKYVSEDVLNDLLSGKSSDSDLCELKDGPIEFVLVAVRGETPTIVSQRMGQVADIACRHNGIVDCLVSSVVIIVYGMIDFEKEHEGDRFTLIEDLRENFRDDIKIVHGIESGCFGNVGNATRMSFSFIIPNFVDALGSLANLSYGHTKQV